jgi:hypothetical protein
MNENFKPSGTDQILTSMSGRLVTSPLIERRFDRVLLGSDSGFEKPTPGNDIEILRRHKFLDNALEVREV